ncbi:UNVERIFIED_CONTAM: hypothetical protein RMT77_017229 [Armadillidium vulgare]
MTFHKSSFLKVLFLLLLIIQFSFCGGKWSKLPKKQKIRQPITGKYRSEGASRYYNNPEGAKIIKSSHFNLVYVLGHKIVFLCVAQGSPPPSITWFKDGVELFGHKYMQLHEWHYGKKLKSKMEIDPATQADAGIYECHANNKYAVDSAAFRTTYLAEFN